jgi:hypothetical protein
VKCIPMSRFYSGLMIQVDVDSCDIEMLVLDPFKSCPGSMFFDIWIADC